MRSRDILPLLALLVVPPIAEEETKRRRSEVCEEGRGLEIWREWRERERESETSL
jgi:hypothetical protein